MLCDLYWDWDMWQGNLGDNAWLLSHGFGFLLPPIPQAHAFNEDEDKPYVLLPFQLPLPRPLHSRMAERHQYLRPTAFTEILVQNSMFGREHKMRRRNRWQEQQARGGQPHENLLDTDTIQHYYSTAVQVFTNLRPLAPNRKVFDRVEIIRYIYIYFNLTLVQLSENRPPENLKRYAEVRLGG
ncbi:hypothetical protein B0H16DRAFT_1608047 [Mycena metata]|uniref:Uncharacterized protein n=1 Tax=Mycena metata TaxID=1033252 RepID=A0AAD7HFJ4_9AGAR|nr:hypothetical protein B0H16DRAFT_1608047 [Mycena metata]